MELKCRGAITRIVNGGVDEVLYENNSSDHSIYSYYDNPGILDRDNWYSDENINYYYEHTYQPDIPVPYPDEFTFNFNGILGSFYYNHKGKWVVKSNQAISIRIKEEIIENFELEEETYHGLSSIITRDLKRIFYGFTLITSDGTIYTFGKSPDAIEFSSTSPNEDTYNTNYIATTWYLTKITLPNKKNIIFEYAKETKAVFKQSVAINISSWINESGNNEEHNDSKIKNIQRLFLTYLHKIKTENTELTFNKSLSNELGYGFSDVDLNLSSWDGLDDYHDDFTTEYKGILHWYKLDSITIKDKNEYPIKRIEFNYTENPNIRLFLKNIKEYGANDETPPKNYAFEYNETDLPPYNAQKTDHWGYYNGNNYFDNHSPAGGNNNYTLEQAQAPDYYNSRQPDSILMKAGVLTKIIYPTGGNSKFVYEPHEYSLVVVKNIDYLDTVPNTISGGLRIKKIISTPGDISIPPIIKEYFYVNDFKNGEFTSSGILAGYPKYLEFGYVDGVIDYWFWNSYSVEPMCYTNGNHVTYSKVVENNTDNGFVEYCYSNHDNVEYRDEPMHESRANSAEQLNYLPFNSRALIRGKLLSEKYFDNNNSIKKQFRYDYKELPDSPENTIRAVYINTRQYGEPYDMVSYIDWSNVVFSHVLSAFSIYKYLYYLETKEEIEYDQFKNPTITQITNYKYSDYRLLTEINKNSSDGSEFKTEIKYPIDFPDNLVLSNMASDQRNMLNYPIETIKYKNGKVIQSSITSYKFSDGEDENGTIIPNALVVPFETYALETDKALSDYIPATPNFTPDPRCKIEGSIDKYDTKGNILQTHKTNGRYTSYLWAYNKSYPVAKIENATFADVEAALTTIASSVADIETKSLATDDETQLLALFEALRATTEMANTMITSYTYDPLIGIKTETDANGKSIYYEYDALGRLKTIRNADKDILKDYTYQYKGVE